jgi:hypothetical protein
MSKHKLTGVLVLLAICNIAFAQKVFSVEYESQAGWRSKKKMHLMY